MKIHFVDTDNPERIIVRINGRTSGKVAEINQRFPDRSPKFYGVEAVIPKIRIIATKQAVKDFKEACSKKPDVCKERLLGVPNHNFNFWL